MAQWKNKINNMENENLLYSPIQVIEEKVWYTISKTVLSLIIMIFKNEPEEKEAERIKIKKNNLVGSKK